MSTTIPPAPPPMPAPPAGGGGAGVVQVVEASARTLEALAKLPQVDVVLLSRPVRGMVEVMAGDQRLTLRLPPDMATLPAGSRLTLQLAGQGGETLFRVLAFNGKPMLPGGIPLVPTAATLPPGAAMTVAGAPAISQSAGSPAAASLSPAIGAIPAAPTALGVTATMLRPAVATPMGQAAPLPGSGGLPPNLPPGTTVTVRIAGTQPPGAPPAQAPSPAQPSVQPASVPSATAPAPARPAASVPAPAQPSATVPGASAGPAAPPPPPAPGAPPLVTGTVTAHPPGGQAVVRTPAGALAVPTPHDLPVGARVTLEIVGKPELPLPAMAASAAKPEGLTPAGWPALTQTIETLAGADARLAEQLLRNLPQANPRLAASMSMFAAALRTGDARALVSDAVTRGLERAGKRDLGDRLKGDIEKLAGDSARSLGGAGEWRALTMPFVNGAQVEPIRLYIKHMNDTDDGGGRGGGRDGERFVLEVSMTRLGRLQLDGLVRRADKAFDLIVRTQEPLPQEMRHDITAIFVENAEVIGITGQVTFQAGRFVELPAVEAAPTALMV